MNTEFLNVFDTLPYFTIEAVKQLIGDENMAAGTIPTALYRWMKEGHIYQLKRGVYMTHRFYELHRSDADFAPAVSAILIPQSYVSAGLYFTKVRYSNRDNLPGHSHHPQTNPCDRK
jgi:predicted transcriptional regulator of viral defense system